MVRFGHQLLPMNQLHPQMAESTYELLFQVVAGGMKDNDEERSSSQLAALRSQVPKVFQTEALTGA